MFTPTIKCKIDIYCSIYPSEDPKKVKKAVSNLFNDIEIQSEEESIKATSNDLQILQKIYETIHSKKNQKIYRRHLKKNLIDDTTWFYLNKQAAFVNTIALCDEAEESPLGPIKVIIQSNNIEEVIDWIVSD